LNKSRINSHRIWKLYVLGKFINWDSNNLHTC
jgi:hypothetical protein